MKPKQFFFIVLGVIGAVLLIAGGGYYYALTRLHTEASSEASQLATQTQDESQISSLRRLEYQYNHDIEPILPLMNEALPTAKKQTEILAQLQNIATSVGLSITTISMPNPVGLPTSISQTIKSGTVLALPISFQLSGSYQQLQTFTEQVENLNRFTDITNLAISRPDKTQPIVYSISLNAYIMP
ncbi:MAG TPA: type 4a pilus biogenesis protein PilO [Candidatus Saccharimonadia bacterium]|nr:type 4a pilus biogenesis protein PilO [Candidatus Saccharimonadia bacterium]